MEVKNQYIIIKCDVSGIQDFIFNIKSKGAAKSLKARSFFIDAVGLLAEEYLKGVFKDAVTLYNGGGNFYLKIPLNCWDEATFKIAQSYFLKVFNTINISLNIDFITYKDTDAYGEIINTLNTKVNDFKLRKSKHSDFMFQTFEKLDQDAQSYFIKFSKNLTKKKHYKIIDVTDSEVLNYPELIASNSITLFKKRLVLTDNPKDRNVISHIPLWNDDLLNTYKAELEKRALEDENKEIPKSGDIIDFSFLAFFAKERTGTEKIAALKLDIDNLGSLFRSVTNEGDNIKLSAYISRFFTDNFNQLIQSDYQYQDLKKDTNGNIKTSTNPFIIRGKKRNITTNHFESKTSKYRDHLYVVFAGGDDCFIIGAWDVLIDFTIGLKREFDVYQDKICKQLHLEKPITFSAAIIIIDSHYPIVKIADLAEERLHQAKSHIIDASLLDATNNPMKNKISFLNKIFTWDEFSEVVKLKNTFAKMILKYGEKRAFLQKIQHLFESKDNIFWIKTNKPYNPSTLWRFKYLFRDIKKQAYFENEFYTSFFGKEGIYNTEIFETYTINHVKNQKLPVAARWAEFLTK